MFLGTYEHRLDAKGRISFPARFREVLSSLGDGRLIVTTNVDPGARCLVAYPMGEWQVFQNRIGDLPQFDENVIRLKRLHVAGAAECVLDRQGRIQLPAALRDYAGCKEGAVIFAGVGSSLEIWDRVLWEKERERAKECLPQINETLARLGL